MTEFVTDPRHRHSYELRPDPQLDAQLRAIAANLEAAGLLEPGASTAPRFQPHLTLLRAVRADERLVELVADHVAGQAELRFLDVGSFGGGRIAWLAPEEDEALRAARTIVIDALGEEHVDPLSLARSPWVPHVTLAYAVDKPHREQVLDELRRSLPLTGTWHVAQCWDLDVRPTRLIHARSLISS